MNLKEQLLKSFQKFSSGVRNLQSWGQIATTPQLRQDYSRYVIKPPIQRIQQQVQPALQKIQQAPKPWQPSSYLPQVGRAMQRVTIPKIPVSPALKAGVPLLQVPEQAEAYIQSYGRTLAEPSKHPIETALNVWPFMGGIASKVRPTAVPLKDITKARTMFGDQIRALEGDVTKAYTKEQIDGAIKLLKGKNIKMAKNAFEETAIKLANFIDAAEKGTMVNQPAVGLSVQSIRGKIKEATKGVGGVGKIKSSLPPTDKALLVETGKLPPLAGLATKGKIILKQTLPKQTTRGGMSTNDLKIPSLSGIITDPVQKIIQALKIAKPLEKQQAGIYTKIRSQQAGAIAGVGKNIPGEKGFFAQLGQLKGEIPKVEFESIRKQIGQTDIDSLFNKVEQSILTPFEKISAKSGLAKLLGVEGGSVPVQSELKLLNEVFPPEFIQAVLDKRTIMQKLLSTGGQLLNLPRAMMATADLSAPLRQGLFLIGRPKEWLSAFGNMFKYAFSEKAYQGLAKDIQTRPTYQLMRENKLALTDTSPLLQGREEAFMSNLSEKIPIFGRLARGSNRAYSGFLNKLRADTFDSILKSAQHIGVDIKMIAPSLAKFVNSATGRGDIGALSKASVILNGVLFSPRLMMSRLNLLNPAFYIGLNPIVRKEALKSLFTFAGTGLTVLGLAKLGGAEVGADPRSADFGKVKIGNTRYDTWGGFQQYIKIAAQLLSGKLISTTTGKEYTLGEGYKPLTRKDILLKFVESKQAPVASFITSLLEGTNSIGQPFNLAPEAVNRFIPMVVQDMYELAKEKDSPLASLLGIPGVFGVGVQTYGKQIPSLEITPAGKPTIKLKPVGGLGEDIISKITGQQPSNIPQEQWQGLVGAKTQETQKAIELDKLKKEMEGGKIQAGQAVQSTYNIDGQKTEGYELNGKFLYTDPETGNITTKSVKTIKQQELSQEKELIDAQYSLASDQLKRADNYATWAELTQNYIDYLGEYKNKQADEADKLKTQNKIEDLETSLAKYKGYGGFKKPKKPKMTATRPTLKSLKASAPKKTKTLKEYMKEAKYMKLIKHKKIKKPKIF